MATSRSGTAHRTAHSHRISQWEASPDGDPGGGFALNKYAPHLESPVDAWEVSREG